MAAVPLFSGALLAQDFVWASATAPNLNWRGIASSSTSTTAPIKNWYSVASSSNGHELAAVVNGGPIYISSNAGATWTQCSAPNAANWHAIALSSDGTKLLAVVPFGSIYLSTNS